MVITSREKMINKLAEKWKGSNTIIEIFENNKNKKKKKSKEKRVGMG